MLPKPKRPAIKKEGKAMALNINLEIVTPFGPALKETVEMVSAPATEGSLGILPNHLPLMTTLDIGVVKYIKEGEEHFMAISGGFLEVRENKVVILANAAEKAEEIDVPRAADAKDRAERRLKHQLDTTDLDCNQARLSLKRAKNRIKVAEMAKFAKDQNRL